MRRLLLMVVGLMSCGGSTALLPVEVTAVREANDTVTVRAGLACVSAYKGEVDPGCANEPSGYCLSAEWTREADGKRLDQVESCRTVRLAGAEVARFEVSSTVAIPREGVRLAVTSLARQGTSMAASGPTVIPNP